jgi:hypothetical protein
LRRILGRLDSTHAKLLAIVNPLDSGLYNQRLTDNEWSVAEILQHLYLAEERVVADLEKGRAGNPVRVGPLRRLIPTVIVSWRLVRVKAPRAVTPTDAPDKDVVLENYAAVRKRLKGLCTTHGKQKLRRTVFKHPFLGKMNGVAAVSMIGYHELRHYKQIRELLLKLERVDYN